MASLFVIQGRDQGRRYELEAPAVNLGRDTSNTVQLHDTEVSRRHAELRREADQFWLVDLGSSNGTFVNSQRVQRHALRSGDRVQLGRTMMIFTDGRNAPVEDLSDIVDIVGRNTEDGSRIVRSISHDEGSHVLGGPTGTESPWLARARSNLQIMYRTALAVSHTLDIDQLLERIMELIFEWVEADRGCIMLLDEETHELLPRTRRNRPGVRTDERMVISRTILDYVMENKEGVLTSDAQDDGRWDPAGSIVKLGVREAICVPMQGRYGIVGVIYIDTYTPPERTLPRGRQASSLGNRFNEEHLKLMVAIAHQAALAVEDTNYYSAMVQAERLAAIGQTIATLSHHIKNILQGIKSGSWLVDNGLADEKLDIVSKGWRIVEKNQARISNLVMDMLSFSKEREPDLAPADLNETVGDVVELMQQRAADAKVALEFQPQHPLPRFRFDADAIHRAVLNVLTNAIDACEAVHDGRVEVSTVYEAEPQRLIVTIADNGPGIGEEYLPRIFNIFESGKGNRGTGLGLPVTRKILREHGGDVWVESTVGEGSRFTLCLPAQLADRREDPTEFETHFEPGGPLGGS